MLQLSNVSRYSTETWIWPKVLTEPISPSRQMNCECPASSVWLWVSWSGSIPHYSQDLPGPVQRQSVLVPLPHTAWNLSSLEHSLPMRFAVRNQSHTLPIQGKGPQPSAEPHSHSVDRIMNCINLSLSYCSFHALWYIKTSVTQIVHLLVLPEVLCKFDSCLTVHHQCRWII